MATNVHEVLVMIGELYDCIDEISLAYKRIVSVVDIKGETFGGDV